jgi:Zn-dependent protease/predicted transcriptional regulator
MRGSLYLGKILGIPIRLHLSWFIIAILVTWTLASGYFPQENPGWASTTYWIVGGVASILLFASVLLHELGHSVLALRENVPVKSITLFLFGGVAQIGREPPTAGAEFRIAIAGPLTSLGLAALFGGLGALFTDYAVLGAPLAYLGGINLLLAAFNMIPGFPLDGGRVLRAALWGWRGSFRSATRWATRAGQVVAVLFIAFGAFQFLLGGWVNGLWFAFIGWYLNNAARASYQQAALQEALAGVKARNVTMERCTPISSDLRLDLLVQDHVLKEGQSCFFVMDTEQPQGVVTLNDVKRVARDQRAAMTTSQVMTPMGRLSSVDADEDVWNLVQKMSEEDTNQMPVVDGGQLLGLITRDNLMNHLRLRSELAA